MKLKNNGTQISTHISSQCNDSIKDITNLIRGSNNDGKRSAFKSLINTPKKANMNSLQHGPLTTLQRMNIMPGEYLKKYVRIP